MAKRVRILWKEGMFVLPHHFQQWDIYHEETLKSAVSEVLSYPWGVSSLSIDQDAVANGVLSVTGFSGIMPDGMIISEADQPIEARSFAGFFTGSSLDVFIGIPMYKESSQNCQTEEGPRNFRFYEEKRNLCDLNSGENEKQISTCKNSIRVLFSGEMQSDMTVLKIAQVGRTSTGGFELVRDYIPPSLRIFGRLYEMLKGILEMLSAKSSSLSVQRRSSATGGVEFGTSDISNFWLLHTINLFIPRLLHIYNTPQKSPESLYEVLVSLAGAMCTFSSEGHPKDLPAYEHANMYNTFSQLEARVRSLTETVVSARSTDIMLERNRQTLWVGRILDDNLLLNSRFYLAVSGLEDSTFKDIVSKRLKLGSLNDIDIIVNSAMSGISAFHVPRPPSSIVVKSGYQYFLIDNTGDFWESAKRSKTIAVYVPSDLTGIRLELVSSQE